MFVYREEYYLEKRTEGRISRICGMARKDEFAHNQAEIIIGKQRHGPTGLIKLEFESAFTKFSDAKSK